MRKLLAATAGIVLALSLTTGALAWGDITLTAKCMPDQATLAWSIQLPSENNFKIDWSFDADFSTATTVDFGSAGAHDFTTPNGGPVLYVRWSSEQDITAQANRNEQPCSSAPSPEGSALGGGSTPSGSPEGGVQGGAGTPAPGIPDTASAAPGQVSPIPVIAFAVILLAALGGLAFATVRAR